MRTRAGFKPTLESFATAYADQAADEFVIPESFDGMEYAAVEALYAQAREQFDALYSSDVGSRTDVQLSQLAQITEGLEALAAELAARDAAAAEAEAEAEALAARIHGLRANTDEETSEEADDEGEDTEDEEEEPPAEDESAAETIVAAATPRREVRLPRFTRQAPAEPTAASASVIHSAGEGTGFAAGTGMSIDDLGRAIDRKLGSANEAQYRSAYASGRRLRQQHSIATLERNFDGLMISDEGPEATLAILDQAADPARVRGRNGETGLVASGGWCAPSETLYDLLELETRDGMFSLPEVGINRGGIRFTRGPSFGDIFSQINGFSFTEEEDIDGKYQPGADGNVVGPKPCYHVECTDFEDVRLGVDGLCITAGLLMSKGYPELIARTVRGALVAHEHRMNARLIQAVVADSTPVNMGTQVGTVAPLLDSIEKQVLHYRATHRLGLNQVLEATFPFWVFGAIRSDLSRREGVDLIDVPDARIRAWFASRGVSAQFVYNWQQIDTTAAGDFTAWPTTVSFTLYLAGTFVRGSSPLITLDTLYDSTLLANNDYTALFTEEGWLVAKRGFDSRVVTVGVDFPGAAAASQVIAASGAVVPPVTPEGV